MRPDLRKSRLLIVDDNPTNLRLLEKILRPQGYEHLHLTTNPRDALRMVAELDPDLVLLDLHMPELDGFEVMAVVRELEDDRRFRPILVLTADMSPDTRRRALASGATDFLSKPFDREEVLLRIQNLLHTRVLNERLNHENVHLDHLVAERTKDLEAAQIEIAERLAAAAEYRDDDTGQHTRRVGEMSAAIARVMGMSDGEVELMRRAAPLHDVGKIGIPDEILLKPGRLAADEFDVMRTHSAIGGLILAGSRAPLLKMAETIAVTHHERFDGSGYLGLVGEGIPLEGRIVAIADVFDALTHERPYKEAWPVPDAVAEIVAQGDRQFDPAVVDAFLRVLGSAAEEADVA